MCSSLLSAERKSILSVNWGHVASPLLVETVAIDGAQDARDNCILSLSADLVDEEAGALASRPWLWITGQIVIPGGGIRHSAPRQLKRR